MCAGPDVVCFAYPACEFVIELVEAGYMQAPPSILDSALDKARALLRTGWRPPFAEGPSRSELAGLLLQPV